MQKYIWPHDAIGNRAALHTSLCLVSPTAYQKPPATSRGIHIFFPAAGGYLLVTDWSLGLCDWGVNQYVVYITRILEFYGQNQFP